MARRRPLAGARGAPLGHRVGRAPRRRLRRGGLRSAPARGHVVGRHPLQPFGLRPPHRPGRGRRRRPRCRRLRGARGRPRRPRVDRGARLHPPRSRREPPLPVRSPRREGGAPHLGFVLQLPLRPARVAGSVQRVEVGRVHRAGRGRGRRRRRDHAALDPPDQDGRALPPADPRPDGVGRRGLAGRRAAGVPLSHRRASPGVGPLRPGQRPDGRVDRRGGPHRAPA